MAEFATKLLTAGLLAWFALLFALIFVRMLQGKLRAEGILAGSSSRIGEVDPERAVLMAVFPFVLSYYVIQALNADVSGVTHPPTLPDIPPWLLVALTGSNSLYLAGKMPGIPRETRAMNAQNIAIYSFLVISIILLLFAFMVLWKIYKNEISLDECSLKAGQPASRRACRASSS